MNKPQRSISPKIAFHLHRWHRRFGVISALFILLLSITGILLQHPEGFGLTKSKVEQQWLLKSYGIDLPKVDEGFKFKQRYITQIDDVIFLDDSKLANFSDKIIAAAPTGEWWFVAGTESILLFTSTDELIDKISYPLLIETPVTQISSSGSMVVVKAQNGFFQISKDWDKANTINFIREPSWILAESLPQELAQQIQYSFRSQQLNWERVVLDLHSGRLLGQWGPWLMDLMAALFIILAISGIWLWSRKKRW
ncbi:MAG: PepSY-associated TM helix domain-containing protein [Gammaproteobacteria bacterium]|nr:PepSY-associated TM helix domain-containing protein [Gammaproteobacteria bacterium]